MSSDAPQVSRWPPPHFNPPPCFGLRIRLSRTAQAIRCMLERAGPDGIERDRLKGLLYMTDVKAREYLGRPITDIRWRVGDLPCPASPEHMEGGNERQAEDDA